MTSTVKRSRRGGSRRVMVAVVEWGGRARGVARVVARAAMVGVVSSVMVASGCAGPDVIGRGSPTTPPGTTREIAGDMDDVDAAVDVAISASQLALVRREEPEPGVVRYTLVTLGDEPGVAVVREGGREGASVGANGEASVGAIVVTVRIRARGDDAWEKRFLDALAKRLGQLRGVDAAPIKGFGPFDTH